jgi:hypothetical protein
LTTKTRALLGGDRHLPALVSLSFSASPSVKG